MKNYIESYESILPESERQKLQGLLDVGAKAITDEVTGNAETLLEEKIRELMGQLGQTKMTMQLRLQEEGGQTNSVSYNLNLQEAIADLKTLYDESNKIDSLLVNHQQLNKTTLAMLAKDIKRLESRIDTLNLLADNVYGYGTASRENFSDQSLVETDRGTYAGLYIDRDGSKLGEDLECQIDPVEGTLKLGTSESYDRIHTSNGTTIASIEILEQVGEGYSDKDPNYGPAKALDGRIDTFWGEVILADGILKIPMAVSENVNITTGALCKFKISFPTPVSVSQFSFKPYCEFPIEICSIAYTTNDSNVIEPGNYCVSYDAAHPILTDKGITLDFQKVLAKALIVTIRQSSSTKNNYIVSLEEKTNKEVWAKIAAAERKLSAESIWVEDTGQPTNKCLTQDMVDQFDVRWQSYIAAQKKYLEAISKNGTDSGDRISGTLSSLLRISPPKRVHVEKYEYVFGAYEIDVRGQEYNRVGVYVSKPHTVNGNVQTVVLESSEWHPTFLNSVGGTLYKTVYNESGSLVTFPEPVRRTSIEYYVSPGESDQWIPILPLGQNYINSEFLIFPDKSVPRAKLRWPAKEVDGDQGIMVRIYKNEIPLQPQTWSWADENHQTIEIFPAYWDPEAFYTVDYYPNEELVDAHEIDFTPGSGYIGQPKTIKEYFNGPGEPAVDKNCTMNLKYYPYVNREKIATRDISGNIYITDNDFLYNPVRVTINPSEHPSLNPKVHMINGPKVITTEITSARNPKTDIPNPPLARCLNVTDYFDRVLPVLNQYIPAQNQMTNPIPTFEYYHDGKKLVMTETFRHDGPSENYGVSNGNAIIKVEYEYLVSGVRCRIIMRRNSRTDTSVTPKVDWYALKFKVLV